MCPKAQHLNLLSDTIFERGEKLFHRLIKHAGSLGSTQEAGVVLGELLRFSRAFLTSHEHQ